MILMLLGSHGRLAQRDAEYSMLLHPNKMRQALCLVPEDAEETSQSYLRRFPTIHLADIRISIVVSLVEDTLIRSFSIHQNTIFVDTALTSKTLMSSNVIQYMYNRDRSGTPLTLEWNHLTHLLRCVRSSNNTCPLPGFPIPVTHLAAQLQPHDLGSR